MSENQEPKPLTEDEEVFGVGAWVYCNQHMRAHQTGWCSVGPRNKVGLGVKTAEQARQKCRDWSFPLYEDLQKQTTTTAAQGRAQAEPGGE